ncbi:hypothetical protein, conserved [Eimeria brunetti]|uniref:Protein kinase domain-containing protein n=1 Tax=Eimeria brunetti TaxID=51314 RepID=U6LS25_9EIME|nr:hypothetical protein, conserved [Eimeria brunetti]
MEKGQQQQEQLRGGAAATTAAAAAAAATDDTEAAVELEDGEEGTNSMQEELGEIQEEDSFELADFLPLSETHRSRRNWSLLTFAAITLPTLLLFGCLMYASIKAHQQLPTWADLVLPQPLPAGSSSSAAGGAGAGAAATGTGTAAAAAAAAAEPPPWQAPPVDSPEERASPTAQVVRGVLWDLVNQLEEEDPPEPSEEAKRIMREIAKTLSKGEREELVGAPIELEALTEVGSGRPLGGPRSFIVTKFIGEGPQCLLLAIKDVESREETALRINTLPPEEQPSIFAAGEREISAQMVRTAQGLMAVRGPLSAAAAAAQKGVAAVHAVGRVRGLPPVLHAGSSNILSTVEQLGLVQVPLRDIIDAMGLVPTGTRAYLARNVLKIVLNLQKAGISSNQINSSSFTVQEDGSVLLLGFESAVPFAAAVPFDLTVAAATTDPELLASIVCMQQQEVQPLAGAPSDLWSLGLLLYEILMDGALPFGLDNLEGEGDAAVAYVLQLRSSANPEALTLDMEYRGLHPRWQQLIRLLLQPSSSSRITAAEIVQQFPDLLQGLPEQETLENDVFFHLFFKENPDFYKRQAKIPIVKREATKADYSSPFKTDLGVKETEKIIQENNNKDLRRPTGLTSPYTPDAGRRSFSFEPAATGPAAAAAGPAAAAAGPAAAAAGPAAAAAGPAAAAAGKSSLYTLAMGGPMEGVISGRGAAAEALASNRAAAAEAAAAAAGPAAAAAAAAAAEAQPQPGRHQIGQALLAPRPRGAEPFSVSTSTAAPPPSTAAAAAAAPAAAAAAASPAAAAAAGQGRSAGPYSPISPIHVQTQRPVTSRFWNPDAGGRP